MRTLFAVILCVLLSTTQAAAFTREELKAAGAPEDQIPTVPSLIEKTDNLGEIPTFRENGALSWGALANLEVAYIAHGPGMTEAKRSVRKEVQELSGHEVRIEGFIYPLQAAERHDYFLLSGLPPSCPFCLPSGPAGMIEVKAAQAVKNTEKPVMLTGRFEVLEDDPTGMLYRLTEARPAED
jgi:hypothetical protein